MVRTYFVFSLVAAILLAVLLSGSVARQEAHPLDPAYWPTHAWRSSSPEEQGMDSAVLASMFAAIQDRALNLHSL